MMGLVFSGLGNRMFHRLLVSLGLYFCIFGTAHAKVTAERVDLGEQRPGVHAIARIRLSNDSAIAATVLRLRPSAIHMEARKLPLAVPPHGSAELDVDILVDRGLGTQTYFVDLDLDGEQGRLLASAALFVDSAIDGEPKQVDFGTVTAGKQAEQSVDLVSLDLPDLRVRSAKDEAAQVVPEIANDGRALVLRARPDLPWGMHEGFVEVTTNSTQQPTAWVKYGFETRGRVVPERYEIYMGLQRVGRTSPQTLFVRDLEGERLHLGALTHKGSEVKVKEIDCPTKSESCRGLQVIVDDKQPIGKISGVLNVELPQYKQNLAIAYLGALVSASATLTDLSTGALQGSVPEPQKDLISSIKIATSEKPAPIIMPEPSGKGPLLKWNVQNEQQLYGYIIYRAESENGTLRRINTSIIRTLSAQDGIPVEYRWRDTSAQPGSTYWYQIGTVNKRGVRNDLTGRVKKTYTLDAATAK